MLDRCISREKRLKMYELNKGINAFSCQIQYARKHQYQREKF